MGTSTGSFLRLEHEASLEEEILRDSLLQIQILPGDQNLPGGLASCLLGCFWAKVPYNLNTGGSVGKYYWFNAINILFFCNLNSLYNSKAKFEESHPLPKSAKALLSCFHCCWLAQSLFLAHSNSMFSLFPKLDFYSCVFQWVVTGPKIPPFLAIMSYTSTSEKAR